MKRIQSFNEALVTFESILFHQWQILNYFKIFLKTGHQF